MKSDVGMPCQKVTNKDLKVKVNIQKFTHPFIFSQYREDV